MCRAADVRFRVGAKKRAVACDGEGDFAPHWTSLGWSYPRRPAVSERYMKIVRKRLHSCVHNARASHATRVFFANSIASCVWKRLSSGSAGARDASGVIKPNDCTLDCARMAVVAPERAVTTPMGSRFPNVSIDSFGNWLTRRTACASEGSMTAQSTAFVAPWLLPAALSRAKTAKRAGPSACEARTPARSEPVVTNPTVPPGLLMKPHPTRYS